MHVNVSEHSHIIQVRAVEFTVFLIYMHLWALSNFRYIQGNIFKLKRNVMFSEVLDSAFISFAKLKKKSGSIQFFAGYLSRLS